MTRPQRERVVLAERRGARLVRARVEVQEQTAVGDVLIRGLVRAQLGLAVRLATLTVCVLGSIPLLGLMIPGWANAAVFGVRLPWLLLGVASFPLLFVVGVAYVRMADRLEREFTRLTED